MVSILVVDDSAVDRRLAGGLLAKQDGWVVHYASGGKDAASWLREHTVDVVVTDGFTGNVVLKTAEGAANLLGQSLRRAAGHKVVRDTGYDAALPDPTADEPDRAEPGRVLRGFKVVHVFDIAQTDGADLPDVTPTLLTGDAPTAAWDMLAAHIAHAGFALERGDCHGANGYTNHTTRTVRVRDDVDGAQAVKTLAHELGHVLLHDRTGDDRARMEIEAESVAYLVCHQLGIATDDYSFAYLARWSNGNTNLIRATAERAITCARRIINNQKTNTARVA